MYKEFELPKTSLASGFSKHYIYCSPFIQSPLYVTA